MHVIFGNYGNHTIALIQWAYENQLRDVMVVHVETGWQESTWHTRVNDGQALAKKYGFDCQSLVAKPSLPSMIRGREQFPSVKFQWCASFVKGLPFIQWLDEIEATHAVTILMGARRADSRLRQDLPEFVENYEYLAGRTVWYPLYQHDDHAFFQLIKNAGFTILNHASQECSPCIFAAGNDLVNLSAQSVDRLNKLEQQLQQPMFALPIEQMIAQAQKEFNKNFSLEQFDLGCGSRYGCGE